MSDFEPICARDLDRAGVPDWKRRLEEARDAGGATFDTVQRQIRTEYEELTRTEAAS